MDSGLLRLVPMFFLLVHASMLDNTDSSMAPLVPHRQSMVLEVVIPENRHPAYQVTSVVNLVSFPCLNIVVEVIS